MIKIHFKQTFKTQPKKDKSKDKPKDKSKETNSPKKMSKVIRAHSTSICVNCQNKIHVGDDVIEKEKKFADNNFGERTLSESIKKFTSPVSWEHEFCQPDRKTDRRQRRIARYWTKEEFQEYGEFPKIKN